MSKVAAPGFEVPLWRVTVLSIFPEMFPGPLGHSLAGKALESGIGAWKQWTFAVSQAINTAPWTTPPLAAAPAW